MTVTFLTRFSHVYRAQGITGVWLALFRRIASPKARSFKLARELTTGETGFEIGRPSRIFGKGGLLPIYPIAENIDNCNFAATMACPRYLYL